LRNIEISLSLLVFNILITLFKNQKIFSVNKLRKHFLNLISETESLPNVITIKGMIFIKANIDKLVHLKTHLQTFDGKINFLSLIIFRPYSNQRSV